MAETTLQQPLLTVLADMSKSAEKGGLIILVFLLGEVRGRVSELVDAVTDIASGRCPDPAARARAALPCATGVEP